MEHCSKIPKLTVLSMIFILTTINWAIFWK